jgi:hypothetical protein
MAWSSLSSRINSLPLVLAGPILRRVEPQSVTVWLALKEKRTVNLQVLKASGAPMGWTATAAPTVELGKYVHVVAATTSTTSSADALVPGTNYQYNVDFGSGKTLKDADVLNTSLGYPPFTLPSFGQLPNDPATVRIVHGSCRKPHGECHDALSALHEMIKQDAGVPAGRPHMLFLTGDQIYADDVADALLFMLRDAEQHLFKWPVPNPGTWPIGELLPDVTDPASLRPGHRRYLVTHTAGMTAKLDPAHWQVVKSHLVTLNEYCAMYLFAWSDALWPKPEDLPGVGDVFALSYPPEIANNAAKVKHHQEHFAEEVTNLKRFLQTLPDVRRALANVPTYMIFDDHDVTDDWYMNYLWCKRVLDKRLGRRIIRNGLTAFGLFQAWGNTPKQYAPGGMSHTLLTGAGAWRGEEAGTASQQLDVAIGVPTLQAVGSSKQLRQAGGGPHWHFTLQGLGKGPQLPNSRIEVITLDSRTWRAYPGLSEDSPALVSDAGMDEQLGAPIDPTVELTIVIAAAPVVGNLLVEFGQSLQHGCTKAWQWDQESWRGNLHAHQRLLSKLAQRGGIGAGTARRKGRFLLLSGDVHYGFSARLQYWGDKPYGFPTTSATTPADAVFVQLTSSSCKNEMLATRILNILGHGKPKLIGAQEYLGWRTKGAVIRRVSPPESPGASPTVVVQQVEGTPPVFELSGLIGAILFLEMGRGPVASVSLVEDWAFREDYLEADGDKYPVIVAAASSGGAFWTGTTLAGPLGGVVSGAAALAQAWMDDAGAWKVLGQNNLGEIILHWGQGDDKEVVHKLWWRTDCFPPKVAPSPIKPLRSFTVSFSLADSNYKRPSVTVVP